MLSRPSSNALFPISSRRDKVGVFDDACSIISESVAVSLWCCWEIIYIFY